MFDGDEVRVVALWLRGKKRSTAQRYLYEAESFRRAVQKPLADVRLADLQAYARSLEDRPVTTQRAKLGAVRSLISFACKVGYLRFNVGALLVLPKPSGDLAERILSKEEIDRIERAAKNQRDRLIIHLLYAAGLRASELAGLRWRDVKPRRDTGQITVFGKGDKTRVILLHKETWRRVQEYRGPCHTNEPVFPSRKTGDCLTRQSVWQVVHDAVVRSGIRKKVSPHWLRHSHASHALDNGAPIHLVMQTLGHVSLVTTSRYAHARPDNSSGLYLGV